MFTTADPLTRGAIALLMCILTGTALLILVAIFRRWQQIDYSCYLQSLQDRYRPYLMQLLSGTRTIEGIEVLHRLPPEELELLFDPLLATGATEERGILLALCTELGLIDGWQRRLVTEAESGGPASSERVAAGRRPAAASMHLLQRAKGIRNLGVLGHQPSWSLLVKALDDPHPDIQAVALRSLGFIRARESFPELLQRLQAVVLRDLPGPPRQVMQTTLASFDLGCASDLLALLCHGNWQLRFLGIDILRGMVYRSAAREPNFVLPPRVLAPEIADLLVTELWRDPSAEVRGRAGKIIALLPHPLATSVLCDLLSDPCWYVRLHTVQALTRPSHSNTLTLLAIRGCLSDSHWRVREAAINTLISLGRRGKEELYTSFLVSRDAETRLQIVEAMERRGLMAALIGDYGEGAEGLGASVIERVAAGAAPRGFPEVLRLFSPDVRERFQERLLRNACRKIRLNEEAPTPAKVAANLRLPSEFPPVLAA